jgi:hypothetical protein
MVSESRKFVSSSDVDGTNLSGTSICSPNSNFYFIRSLKHFPRHETILIDNLEKLNRVDLDLKKLSTS